MSDTPETDVSCGYALSSHYGRLEGSYLQMDWSGPFVHAEVARKLERERDDLQKAVNGLCKHLGVSPANTTLLAVEVLRIQRERDEALMDRANGDIATMTINHYERILRERDEVREQSQRLRVQLNHYTQANEMAEQAFRERDEAHKIAKRAIDDLAWFNETNAQRLRNELEQIKEETK